MLIINNNNKPCFNNNNKLCFARVALNSDATDKPVALEFPIELEFRNVDFKSVVHSDKVTADSLRFRGVCEEDLNDR